MTIDPEAVIQSFLPCDECGQEIDFCECIVCQECLEFGPGALTVDQDLQLCDFHAEELGVELMPSVPKAIRTEQEGFVEQFRKIQEEK